MRGSERLPWLAPRFPDDKQLRERDLQQIKSEGKVHYLPRGAPARRPVAGGRVFWLVEPILIIPGGSALLPGLQGGTGGHGAGARLGRGTPRAWVPLPLASQGPCWGQTLLQCLQEQLTSLSGFWKHLGSVPVSAVGAQGTCRSAPRVAPGEQSRRGARESFQSGSWLFRVGDTILQLVNVTQPCVIGDKQQLLTATSSVPSPASFAELLGHPLCWTVAVTLQYLS